MAEARATLDVVAPDLLLSRTRFPFSLHHRSTPIASRQSFICSGYCYPEDEQNLLSEQYKVRHPHPRPQWFDMDMGNVGEIVPYVLVISGKVVRRADATTRISFCMRYFSDGYWILTECMTAALESISAQNFMDVGYTPHWQTNACVDGLVLLERFLQCRLDLAYELPTTNNAEEYRDCTCGSLVSYVRDCEWLECDRCKRWCHSTCEVGEFNFDSDEFVCSTCKNFTMETRVPTVYCTGVVFNKRPEKTEFESLIDDEHQTIQEETAREDAMLVMNLAGSKRSRYETDDGLGPMKRGPGRGKSGMVFHTHYGWVDRVDVLC